MCQVYNRGYSFSVKRTTSSAKSPALFFVGWFLDPWRGHARIWHFGDTMGFKSAVERFPEDRLTVIVLTNRADLDANALALQIADLFLSK